VLLWAAKKGQVLLVERLLDRGRADPNITNIYNQTPLLWAATNGHNAVVQVLLTKADVDPDHSDEFGKRPCGQRHSMGTDQLWNYSLPQMVFT
jgi:ankyrin repeat protein